VDGQTNSFKNFDASSDNSVLLNCLVCERRIRDGNWFARLKLGDRRAAFCKPQCVETFLDHRERYAHRIEPEVWTCQPETANASSSIETLLDVAASRQNVPRSWKLAATTGSPAT